MRRLGLLISILASLLSSFDRPGSASEPAWVEAMRKVHANSSGDPGTILHLGDSITYSMAYFAPLQYVDPTKLPPDVQLARKRVASYIQPACYRWKGPDHGNQSGKTAAWALQHIDRWLEALNPEVAVIMFGTNDIRQATIGDHERNLRLLVSRCLDRGVVVILSTIPPMNRYDEKVKQTIGLQRQIASDLKVPLIDFYAHVVNRRPQDWNGAKEIFDDYEQWQVPTIISRDGVHPSNPSKWKEDYSEEGLCRNGNVLRNYLTLMAYSEIIEVVFRGEPPSAISRDVLGPEPAKPNELPDF